MSRTKESEITLGPHTFSYQRYSNKILVGNGPRSYMQVNQNELYLITGSAQLFFTHIPSIKRSSGLKFTKIKTNLVDIIGKKEFKSAPIYRKTYDYRLNLQSKLVFKRYQFKYFFNFMLENKL